MITVKIKLDFVTTFRGQLWGGLAGDEIEIPKELYERVKDYVEKKREVKNG